MKKILLTLGMVVIFVVNVMSQVNHYVVSVETRDNMAYLYVDPKAYENLDDLGKVALLKATANQYHVSSFCVICSHVTELWQTFGDTIEMIDSWDKDNTTPLKAKRFQRSIEHPWFFNLSGAVGMSISPESESNILSGTVSGCGRIGCYILKGRWDLALNGLVGYNISDEDDGSYSNSVGVDTRVYILKGKAINPFAGIGLAYAFGSDQSSYTIPISAGMSISVMQNGFIDLCYQYNNVTKSSFIIGYTYMHK